MASLALLFHLVDRAEGFTACDIYRKQWSLLDDREIVDEALGELVETGWLLQSLQGDSESGDDLRHHSFKSSRNSDAGSTLVTSN
jgi:hypothetical protein